MKHKEQLDDMDRPLYLISIVSEILDVHPQTLRTYEREGFVRPTRSGGQRLYSQADVERLGLVLELTRNLGVNRAGVDIILRMRHRLESLQGEMERMMDYLESDTRKSFQQKIEKIFKSDD